MTVVYIDGVFFLNLILNYLLLAAAARLAGERLYRLRMSLGALLGALYAVASYLPGLGFLSASLTKLGVAVLMVLIAFGGVRRLLRLILIFFGVSFAFGGGVLALSLLGGGNLDLSGNFIGAAGFKELLLSFAFCYLILTLVFRRTARHGGSRRDIVSVTLRFGQRETTVNALMDSGNTLTDPLTNAPVLVTELGPVRPLLGKEYLSILTPDSLKDPAGTLERLAEASLAGRFRLLPYKTVGVDCGLLLALRTEEIVVGGRRQKQMLAALSPTRLSDGGAYAALVGCLEETDGQSGFYLVKTMLSEQKRRILGRRQGGPGNAS